MPEARIERRLFGERGRDTGLLAQSRGATVYLAGMDTLAPRLQHRLAQWLAVENAGGVRIIAGSRTALDAQIRLGRFSRGLYQRLALVQLSIAPLRERVEDIEPLVGHFTAICNEKLGRSIAGVSPQVLGILMRYQWPGNVRELANVIERAMVVAKGSVILPEHLPPHLFEARPPAPQGGGDANRLPELSLEAAEREQILRALQASGGKRIEAARLLGLSRRTLYRKLDRYGIA
jgi:DNA-binding NtrC family response regulator